MNAYKYPLLLLLLSLFFVSCSTDSIDDRVDEYTHNVVIPETKIIEVEIMELINNYRIENGFTALAPKSIIKSQTFSHNDYMIEQDQVSHDNFYYRKNFLTNSAGAVKVGENVAFGYPNAEAVVNAWINSDGHRANIEGDFTHFEVSADLDENGHWYYTNIFIKN